MKLYGRFIEDGSLVLLDADTGETMISVEFFGEAKDKLTTGGARAGIFDFIADEVRMLDRYRQGNAMSEIQLLRAKLKDQSAVLTALQAKYNALMEAALDAGIKIPWER